MFKRNLKIVCFAMAMVIMVVLSANAEMKPLISNDASSIALGATPAFDITAVDGLNPNVFVQTFNNPDWVHYTEYYTTPFVRWNNIGELHLKTKDLNNIGSFQSVRSLRWAEAHYALSSGFQFWNGPDIKIEYRSNGAYFANGKDPVDGYNTVMPRPKSFYTFTLIVDGNEYSCGRYICPETVSENITYNYETGVLTYTTTSLKTNTREVDDDTVTVNVVTTSGLKLRSLTFDSSNEFGDLWARRMAIQLYYKFELQYEEAPVEVVEPEVLESIIGGSFQVTQEVAAIDETEQMNTIEVQCLGKDASYRHTLYAVINGEETVLFDSDQVGRTVILGPYPIGTLVNFKLYVHNTDKSYYSGSSDNNPDNVVHVKLDPNAQDDWTFGFEDLYGGGDKDYNDCIFRVVGLKGIDGTGLTF